MTRSLSTWVARVRRGPGAISAPVPHENATAAEPPLFRGALDDPGEGTAPPRWAVRFRGWALEGSGRPRSVELLVNDTVHLPAVLDEARPDVGLALADDSVTTHCGWSITVDLSAWPEGDLRVAVVAIGDSGERVVVARRLLSLRGPVGEARLDLPSPGAVIHDDLLAIRGWAVTSGGGAARVDVAVDGRSVGRARLRIPRPDVAATDPARHGLLTGFEYHGSIPAGHGDVVEVDVSVVMPGGAAIRLPSRRLTMAHTPVEPAALDRAEVLQARTQLQTQHLRTVLSASERSSSRHSLLVFTHALGMGGGELYLQELLRQLVAALRRCVVVSPSDGPLRAELEAMGIEVLISGQVPPVDVDTYEGMVRQICLLTCASGCDVAMVNTLGRSLEADAVTRLGIPAVWAIHESFDLAEWVDLNFPAGPGRPYILQRLERSIRAVSRLVFEAQATSDIFVPHADAGRRVVIPYGVDVVGIDAYVAAVDRQHERAMLGLPADATILVVMGVLEERKSQACLVEAFARVAVRHSDAVLVLVGDRPSEYSTAVHSALAALGLGDRVRVIPMTSVIYPWYAVADVLISASDVESLPRSMLEAMAFGVPVLAADVFGIPELIQHGVNGWLYAARDMDALQAGLEAVLDLSSEDRANIGAAAREHVRRRHRSSLYADAYRELFDAVVRQPS